MKENFQKALVFVLESEGGFSENKSDRGGETNMGIAGKYYPGEDIKNMTVEQAGEIYKWDYWDRIKGDDLPAGVDYVTFDGAVNHGPGTAGKLLQRAINRQGGSLITDGVIGPYTLFRIGKTDIPSLIADILKERDIFYRKIVAAYPKQEIFFKGWMARLAKVAVNVRGFA